MDSRYARTNLATLDLLIAVSLKCRNRILCDHCFSVSLMNMRDLAGNQVIMNVTFVAIVCLRRVGIETSPQLTLCMLYLPSRGSF